MKKLFFLVTFILFTLNVNAFELPAGKTIDKEAVRNGIEKYTAQITQNPNSPDGYYNRAFLLYLIGDIKSAINDYNSLISINPNNEEFYLNRGYLKHISHRPHEALQDYEMAIKIKPNYAFAHNNRGVALSELGRNNESLSAYNLAIQLDQNYADAYYNRGNLKTKIDKNEEALEDFNLAIKLNPTDSAIFNNRGVVKRKLNYNVGALSDFSIAIKLNPEDITAIANRGRLKKRYYDSEGAEDDFKMAIAVAEENPVIIKQITDQAQTNKFIREAETINSQLRESKVATDGIQKIAYHQESKSLASNQPKVNAAVLKVAPENSKTTDLKPVINSNVQPEIDTKPVANPKLAECYYIRALQKYILQNRESALKDFNAAIEYNPSYAEAYYYRAAIKRDFKDESFVDDYKKAISLNPQLKSVNEANVLNILKI